MREGNGALTVNTFQHHVPVESFTVSYEFIYYACVLSSLICIHRPWRECGMSFYRLRLGVSDRVMEH